MACLGFRSFLLSGWLVLMFAVWFAASFVAWWFVAELAAGLGWSGCLAWEVLVAPRVWLVDCVCSCVTLGVRGCLWVVGYPCFICP